MKLKNYFALALLGVMLLSSCSKERDLTKDKQKQIEKQQDNPNTKKEVFKASISVEPFELLEYGADENEARASVISEGYAVPSLDVTKDELTSGAIKAHWGLNGPHAALPDSWYFDQILDDIPSTAPSQSSLYVKENAGGKNEFTFYCPLDLTIFYPSNYYTKLWAYFAFGGVGGTLLAFKGSHGTSPNARIVGIKNGNTQTARQIPLMTLTQPFNNLLAPANPSKSKAVIKPRGCLIGLCFVNKFGEEISVTDISVAKDNALYFEGYFDMTRGEDGNQIFAPSSNPGKKAYFTGDNEAFTYPIYADNSTTTKGYTLTNVAGSFDDEKDNLPLFHLWGMPHPDLNGNKLKLNVKMKLTNGKFVYNTFTIDVPNGGFQEGKSYRLPLLLKSQPNPLMYVAEYNVRKDGLGFVSHHNINPHSDYTNPAHWSATNDVALENWDWAVAKLASGTPLSNAGFILPSKEQWNSIIPTYIHLGSVRSEFHPSEAGFVIGTYTVPASITSDFITVAEGSSFVTYALRFKGTKWASAWRYEWNATKKAMVIKSLGGLQYSNLTLNDLTSSGDAFFTDNPNATTRIFPAYGDRYDDSSPVSDIGNFAHYWSSTLYASGVAWTVDFDSGYTGVSNSNGSKGYPVRPFKKTL